jgi:hypothetical protein
MSSSTMPQSVYSLSLSVNAPSSFCPHVETWVKEQGEVAYCSENSLPHTWMLQSRLFHNIYTIDIALCLNIVTFHFLFCTWVRHYPCVCKNFTTVNSLIRSSSEDHQKEHFLKGNVNSCLLHLIINISHHNMSSIKQLLYKKCRCM